MEFLTKRLARILRSHPDWALEEIYDANRLQQFTYAAMATPLSEGMVLDEDLKLANAFMREVLYQIDFYQLREYILEDVRRERDREET